MVQLRDLSNDVTVTFDTFEDFAVSCGRGWENYRDICSVYGLIQSYTQKSMDERCCITIQEDGMEIIFSREAEEHDL